MMRDSWRLILGIYLFGVCGSSSVTKIIPLSGNIGAQFGLGSAQFGWLVSIIALPAVLLALASAIVVERWGARNVLIVAAAVGVLADAGYYSAHTMGLVWGLRLIEGVAIVHIYTAAPALLMQMTDGRRRTAAMTIWSTYMPVGTALGLGLGGFFSDGEGWRMAFVAHGAMAFAALLVAVSLPRAATGAAGIGPAVALGDRIKALGTAFSRPDLMAFGLCYLLVISLGIGVNFALPQYLARVRDLSMAQASGMVAATTLAMLAGSMIAGGLLTRNVPLRPLFTAIAAMGSVAGTLVFLPGLSLPVTYLVLAGWFTTSGAAIATLLASLPRVAGEGSLAAGAALVNQAGAVATLVNPPIWLLLAAIAGSVTFGSIMLACWLAAIAITAFLARGMPAAA